MIIAQYQITYPELNVTQPKTLIKHSAYLHAKSIQDKSQRKMALEKFGENFFTDESPLYAALKSGVMDLGFGEVKVVGERIVKNRVFIPKNKITYTIGQLVGSHGISFILDMPSKDKWVRIAQFKCHCGNEFIADMANVKSDNTKSCGCSQLPGNRIKKHGMIKSAEYKSWAHMKDRCLNARCKSYMNYGGRGISVCDRWINSFSNFFEDMGARPGVGYSIERVDVNKGYDKSNCVWATVKDQNNNKRNSAFMEYDGLKLTHAQWDEKLGFRSGVVWKRLKRGWSVEKTVKTPIRINGTI